MRRSKRLRATRKTTLMPTVNPALVALGVIQKVRGQRREQGKTSQDSLTRAATKIPR